VIGKTVSHYKIISKLGEGGMGVVYKAEDKKLDRHVAIKFLPHHLQANPEAKKRFIHEAKAASALEHPNICAVYEINETPDQQMYMVMPSYDGQSLQDRINDGPVSVDEALEFVEQIASGLAKAHARGIVHRDIKPGNIFVTEDGHLKILDFGLAKLAGQTKITRTGTTVGTVSYMSPEQAQGEEIEASSDVFSLGVLLYQLLTGHLPFAAEQEAAILYKIMNEDPAPLATHRDNLVDGFQRVIDKALAKDREMRYRGASELLKDLQLVRGGKEVALVRRFSRKARRAVFATVVGLGVIAAGFLIYSRGIDGGNNQGMPSASPKSIAVLPFTNLSGDPENEYFSDGITEDILTQLSKIADLTVISRTSIMRYKNTEKSLREIGKELGVGTILEGSVRRSEGRVRIVGQLIDARSDKHLWAETYDRDLKDIFEVQSDVAKQIALALEAELSPEEKERIAKKPTGDLLAYDYYLKGREYVLRYTKKDNERGLGLYQKALEIDPNYALAYAGISNTYTFGCFLFGFVPAWLDSAIAVAEKALSIDADLAEAHLALGNAYWGKGWLPKALERYQRALEINPNYAAAVGNIGAVYGVLGENAEAFRWLKRTMALSPTIYNAQYTIAIIYINIGDYAKAERWLHRVLEIAPDFLTAELDLILVNVLRTNDPHALEQHKKASSQYPDDIGGLAQAGRIALYLGRDAQAKEYFEKVAELAPGSHKARYANIRLGYLLSKAGEKDEARKRLSVSLASLEDELGQGSTDPFVLHDIAVIHAVQGEKKEACEWLQKAIDAGYLRLPWPPAMDPLFDNLRDDARFKEMMAQLQTKVDKIRKEIEAME
jgi:serine/threonine protein kinase/tetratricopeptide (TPR) repeat protein